MYLLKYYYYNGKFIFCDYEREREGGRKREREREKERERAFSLIFRNNFYTRELNFCN